MEVARWQDGGTRAANSFRIPLTHRSYSEFVSGTPWILTAYSASGGGDLVLWDRRTGVEISPPWKLSTSDLMDFVTTPDGGRSILSLNLTGYLLFDLDHIRSADQWRDGLDAADRLLFAEICVGRSFADGRPLPYETADQLFAAWADFTSRNPEPPPLKPGRETLLRWHRNQEAFHGPDSTPGKWHRARLVALGAE